MKRVGYLTDMYSEEDAILLRLKALSDEEFIIETVDRFSLNSTVSNRVMSMIKTVDIVVANVTKGTSNLFYEIGLAHGAGKPVIIIIKDKKDIPADLKSQQVFTYKNETDSLENIIFTIREMITVAGKKIVGFRGPNDVISNPDFNEEGEGSSFKNLFSFSGLKRSKYLEEWFINLASKVPGWDIITSTNNESLYDLLIWNSLNDNELKALSNPIPVRFKAVRSFRKDMLNDIILTSQKSQLKSLILVTTSINDKYADKLIREMRVKHSINAISLDKNDLINVETPKQLFDVVKKKFLEVIYEEEK